MTIESIFRARTPISMEWSKRAKSCMPDGISTDTRYTEPYGLYIKDASGVHKTDVDGNVYLDFFGGHGSLILGHSHPRVVDAVSSAMGRGIQYAASNPLEVMWAQEIQACVKSADRVRFTGSGTETTLLALRVARAFTGRRKILRISTHYHGWHDFAVSGYMTHMDGSAAPGVLQDIADNTILVRPDDFTALQAAFDQYGPEIAAAVAEPLGAHFGLIPTSDEFILEVADRARKSGALMILDEVVSGFRVDLGGMQAILGISPDLTCLAKVAAGGMPGGALCGRYDVMQILGRLKADGMTNDVRVFHQGTFTANPVTAAAALATIDEIRARDLCPRLSRLGDHVRDQLNMLFDRVGVAWRSYGRYSGIQVEINGPPTLRYKLRMALNLNGLDVSNRSSLFVCSEHDESHVEQLVAGFERSIGMLREERLIA